MSVPCLIFYNNHSQTKCNVCPMLVFNLNLTLYWYPVPQVYTSDHSLVIIFHSINTFIAALIFQTTQSQKRVTFYILLNWWLILQIWFHTSHVFAYTPLTTSLRGGPSCFLFYFRKLVPQVDPRGVQAHETVWQPLVYDIKWILNTYGTYLLWTQVEVIVSVFGRGVNSSFSCQWSNSVPY